MLQKTLPIFSPRKRLTLFLINGDSISSHHNVILIYTNFIIPHRQYVIIKTTNIPNEKEWKHLIDSFIGQHQAAIMMSLFFALMISIFHFRDAQAFLYKITGFRYGFMRCTLTLFTLSMFITIYGLHGVLASAVFLIALRIFWLINLSYSILDQCT